jgi:O-antigen ligase/Flp pilus assembly protein TadD
MRTLRHSLILSRRLTKRSRQGLVQFGREVAAVETNVTISRMTLEKALRFVVLAGIFLLPFLVLYVSKSLFFPFITGKNFAFRVIVEIMAGGWLALALTNPAYRPKKSWLIWAFAAFVIVIGVADIFGAYPHKSLWSNYERMEGWVTLAHLFVYFVVMQAMLNTEKLWKQWWHTSLAVSCLVGLYALFQLSGFITINQGGIRLDATFGNATYLGVYMMFHIFIAALYLARAWVAEPQKRLLYSSLYGGLIALNSFILFFTATRGAMLGLIGGGVLATLILIVLAPRSRVAWRAGVVICGLAVLAGGFWMVRDQAWVHAIEPLHRLALIGDEGLPDARQMNWGMAWQGVKERPFLGWGQENYAAVFDTYYDPGMWAQEPWFDRVHNIIFDWLIAGGVLGLIAYLSLYVFALLMLWRSGAFEPYERAILTGFLAGYFFYLLFTFDNITSYIFFFALLAFITVRANISQPTPVRELLPRAALPYTAVLGVILACGSAWLVNADAIAQNRALIQAIMPQQGGADQNLQYFRKALGYDSAGNQEVREQFVQAAISVIGTQGLPDDFKRTFVSESFAAMEGLANEAPHNARFPLFMGIVLDQAGAYEDAGRYLERARSISPKKQAILFETGLNAFAQGKPDEAVAIFKEAYDAAPEYPDAAAFYAAALIRAKQDAAADELIASIMEKGWADDPRIVSAYAGRTQYGKIIEVLTAHTIQFPDDVEARFVLASAQYAAGNAARAIRELETIKEDHPAAASQADEIIKEIQAGKAL